MTNENYDIEQKTEYFSELINKNYCQLKDFYSHFFIEFCELNSLKVEILNCLLFELYQSSIFSTNHFMERMIKLALIKFHTLDFNYSEIEKYSEKLRESEIEYDNLILFKSLKKALENELITSDQYDFLIKAKDEFRNLYSHAEVSKVIKDNNDFTGFMFSISDVQNKIKEGKPLDIPNPTIIPKFSPAIAQMLQKNNSKEKAFEYFKNIFQILKEIELKIENIKNEKH